MAITNHIKGAVEKFKAKTGTDLQDHVLNATYLNGLEGTSYVDLTSAQTITGTKTFDVAYANVFATGTGTGNYFQCRKFRGGGDANTYYHALDFGYSGHNQWDFFEYGGIYNFYQNTTADGSGKVNLFQISPDGVTSHKPLIADSTLTAKGAFTSSASTTLSSVKSAGILGTDSAGKVYDNSSAYQPKGNYVTTDKAGTISATKTFSSTPVLSTLKNKKVLGTDTNGIIEAHTLGISDITNLETSLNGKANSSHTHSISQITNLQTSLDGKAPKSHTHSISQITNLQTSLDAKLDKTTYEWNKEFAAGSNGAVSLGRYNIYDSQLTFDITSTTNQSISGKLVIATQNGTIYQAKVFGDASGTLVSKLIIYQSAISNSRSWVEVFCNFNGWSKNKVHIYAVALNSATVQKQMTSVSISNGVPAAANVTSGDTKWTGTIVNDFNHSHGNYVTTNTAQTISAKKTFSATPTLSAIKNKKVIGTDANGLIEAHTLGIDDITDLKTQLNGKQPSGAYAERQNAQTITGNWTFTGTTNFNGTTKVNGNEIASKGYVDGIFDSKLNASEATNFAKFTKFDSDTLKMTGARLYRTSAGDAVDRSSMYGYSLQSTYGTTYTRFAGMATIASSQVFIGYYQYTNANGSGGNYIGNVTLSNGRLARVNGSLSSVNELTDAYAVLSDLNNKANKTHTHVISEITNLQSTLNGKANVGHTHVISEITNLQSTLNGKANASHTHTISQINNLQDALDGKQNKIEYPCSFDNSGGSYVKLSRNGTSNYYVHIQHGVAVYGSSSQYPSISVSFPRSFGGTPTVVATFTPSSNSTGAEESIKITGITSTGFTVTTRMASTVSSNYFKINWIAIYTV